MSSSKGLLVAVDKTGRVPPLEAPVKPEWFGVDSFKQTGMVSSKTSFRWRHSTKPLKKVDRLRRASRDILPLHLCARRRHALDSEGSHPALRSRSDQRPPMLPRSCSASRSATTSTRFWRPSGTASAPTHSGCTRAHHPGGRSRKRCQEHSGRAQRRLGKTGARRFIPKVTYSLRFQCRQDTAWSSPWGQAFQLL